jgi:hypothetical protein
MVREGPDTDRRRWQCTYLMSTLCPYAYVDVAGVGACVNQGWARAVTCWAGSGCVVRMRDVFVCWAHGACVNQERARAVMCWVGGGRIVRTHDVARVLGAWHVGRYTEGTVKRCEVSSVEGSQQRWDILFAHIVLRRRGCVESVDDKGGSS